MVLRLAAFPKTSSLPALDVHLARLQAKGRPVVVISTRVPADFLARGLGLADPARLAILDVSGGPRQGVPGLLVDHVPGPHLLELVHLRTERLVRAFSTTPHVVLYDADTVARVVPTDVAVHATRAWAQLSPPDVWTDLVVHDLAGLPPALRQAYDELARHRIQIDASVAVAGGDADPQSLANGTGDGLRATLNAAR